MARLTVSSISGKNNFAHGSKRKHPPRSMQTEGESPRKTSMDAYYRPQLRGSIDVALSDMDETETDAMHQA